MMTLAVEKEVAKDEPFLFTSDNYVENRSDFMQGSRKICSFVCQKEKKSERVFMHLSLWLPKRLFPLPEQKCLSFFITLVLLQLVGMSIDKYT